MARSRYGFFPAGSRGNARPVIGTSTSPIAMILRVGPRYLLVSNYDYLLIALSFRNAFLPEIQKLSR